METKDLTELTDNELAEERIQLDKQITALRAKKKAIQDEVDRRQAAPAGSAHAITNAGGIESQEEVGNG